jgi:hypothetical protein
MGKGDGGGGGRGIGGGGGGEGVGEGGRGGSGPGEYCRLGIIRPGERGHNTLVPRGAPLPFPDPQQLLL